MGEKYKSAFGEGVSILYKPGQGVVNTTKLPTGEKIRWDIMFQLLMRIYILMSQDLYYII